VPCANFDNGAGIQPVPKLPDEIGEDHAKSSAATEVHTPLVFHGSCRPILVPLRPTYFCPGRAGHVRTIGGVENFNRAVDELVDSGLLKRLLARTEITFSNSLIESWWRVLKHQ